MLGWLALACLLSISSADVGSCSRSVAPPSWLTTTGRGLINWATAGIPPTGPNFCLQGNLTAGTMEVDYHIDLAQPAVSVTRPPMQLDGNITNSCVNQDPRIHYCIPFCSDLTLQNDVIEAALRSPHPAAVAPLIHIMIGSPKDRVVSVIEVDYTNPDAHLTAQIFLTPEWCSVYVGMKTIGFPYLYEIQVAKIIV